MLSRYLFVAVLLAACAGCYSSMDAACKVVNDSNKQERMLAQHACEAARQQFTELFGEAAPSGTIRMVDTALAFHAQVKDSTWLIEFPTMAQSRRIQQQLGLEEDFLADYMALVLPHEIGHLLLAAKFFPGMDWDTTGYATPFPDWIDEGVAIAMESEQSRAERLALARNGIKDQPSVLVRLLEAQRRMDHVSAPIAASTTRTIGPATPVRGAHVKVPDMRPMRITQTIYADGRVTADTVYLDNSTDTVDVVPDQFYQLSYAFLTFLAFKLNNAHKTMETIRRMNGTASDTMLLKAALRVKHTDEIENQWRHWLDGTAHQ